MPLLDRNAFAAAFAVVAALASAPLFGDGAGTVTATTASVTARAASVEPVAAPDQRWPVAGEAVQAAIRVADAHWGGPACGGNVALSWTSLTPGTNATASWRNPTHAWDNAPANFDCRIELNAGADYDWVKLCTVLAHELGHLHGRQHDESSDLMAAIYRRPLAVCSATPEPGAPAPAPAPDPEPVEEAAPSVAPATAPVRRAAPVRRTAAPARRGTAGRRPSSKRPAHRSGRSAQARRRVVARTAVVRTRTHYARVTTRR